MIHHRPFKECNRSVESLLLPSGRWMRFIKCIAGAVKVARKLKVFPSKFSLSPFFFIIILSKHSKQLSWWSAASVEKTLCHPQLASYAASSFVLWWRGRGTPISWNPDTVSDGGLVIWSTSTLLPLKLISSNAVFLLVETEVIRKTFPLTSKPKMMESSAGSS